MTSLHGLVNSEIGLGERAHDPLHAFELRWIRPLQQAEQEQYLMRGVLNNLTTAIPNQIAHRWGRATLKGGDNADGLSKLLEQLEQVPVYLQTAQATGIREAFRHALTMAYRSGNGAIIVGAKDGGEWSDPLDYGNIKTISELFVCDRWSIYPDSSTMTGRGIESFRLFPQSALSLFPTGQIIHASRVIWLTGIPGTDESRRNNDYCDFSILQFVARPQILKEAAIDSSVRVMLKNGTTTHLIQGLLENLGYLCETEDTLGTTTVSASDDLVKRLQIAERHESAYRRRILDKDREAVAVDSSPMGGYDQVINAVNGVLLENTPVGIGRVELFGETLRGDFNGGSKATEERKAHNEAVMAIASTLTHHLVGTSSRSPGLVDLFCLAKEGPFGGKKPAGMGWEWLPYYPPTIAEKTEAITQQVTAIERIAAIAPELKIPLLRQVLTNGGDDALFQLDEKVFDELEASDKESRDRDRQLLSDRELAQVNAAVGAIGGLFAVDANIGPNGILSTFAKERSLITLSPEYVESLSQKVAEPDAAPEGEGAPEGGEPVEGETPEDPLANLTQEDIDAMSTEELQALLDQVGE